MDDVNQPSTSTAYVQNRNQVAQPVLPPNEHIINRPNPQIFDLNEIPVNEDEDEGECQYMGEDENEYDYENEDQDEEDY